MKAKTQKTLAQIEASPALAIAIAKNKYEFRDLLNRIQLELVTEENKDSVGHTIYALKEIHDVFDSVIKFGEAEIEKSDKKKENK